MGWGWKLHNSIEKGNIGDILCDIIANIGGDLFFFINNDIGDGCVMFEKVE